MLYINRSIRINQREQYFVHERAGITCLLQD
jgi:hypothetical protein